MEKRLAASLLVFIVAGCVVIPTSLPDKQPFPDKIVGSVTIGETSKSDARTTFGSPRSTYLSGRWWVYELARRSIGWTVVFVDPLEVGYAGESNLGRSSQMHYFLIDFGRHNIADRIFVLNEDKNCNRDETVCYSSGCLRLKETPEPDSDATCPITPDKLQHVVLIERDGIMYEPDASLPFSGKRTYRYADGSKEKEFEYRNGRLNGLETRWDTFGRMVYQAHYKNNVRHGMETLWTTDGSISRQMCYQDGIPADLSVDQCSD